MSKTKIKKSLFEEFPPVSTEEWEKVITKDLNGADYKKKLRWDTGEGVSALPFYRREDLAEIPRKAPIDKKFAKDNTWEILQPVFEQDVDKANEKALDMLNRGADALQFYLKIHRTEGMLGGDLEGTSIQNQKEFSQLLDGVSLEKTTVQFNSGLGSPVLLAMLWNEVANQDLNADQVQALFLYDPFSQVLLSGQLHKPEKEIENDIAQLANFTTKNLRGVRPLGINAKIYHNCGATIIQDLGYALATASEYLSILTESGLKIDEAAKSLHFSFAIGSNYFLEIAKFRAARLLWKNLVDAFGGNTEDTQAYLHGETSRWNKTLYDPYTNMLRTTSEGMSAAIAGCDSITVTPFDRHFKKPSEFSDRIARNSQIIMSEEAYLDKVKDPAAGSYYVENLTEDIAREGWKLFQQVEQEGGLLKSIKNGTVQSSIGQSQKKRDQAIAIRERIFVGSNQYPNPEDKIAGEIDSGYHTIALAKSGENFELNIENLPKDLAGALAEGAQIGDLIPYLFEYGKHYIRTISEYRGTQEFEALRLATEKSKKTPKVLTIPIGTRKMRKARSTFASNFFGCAGYEIKDPIGFKNVKEVIQSIKNDKPDIAVVCSSDEEYKDLVPVVCEEFEKLQNPPLLVLAGYPEEDIETYKKAGIDEFIHAKCNVLETLKNFQLKLGVIERG
jgi:methylmalonyl-CoA mutase